MRSERCDKLILFTVALVWGLIFALRLNIPPVLDEVGSIANTAYLLHWDWSETAWMTGGCYFKYGFTLLYYPFMRFIDDSYVLYKAMLTMNMVFLALIPIIVYDIFRRHLFAGRLSSILFSLSSAVFPSTLLYMTYAKADVILIFLPFPILLILLELSKLRIKGLAPELVRRNRIKQILLSILLAFLTMYAYMSHTRGLAVVLAVITAIILIRLICGLRTVNYISFVLTFIIMFLADKKLSAFFKNAVYGVYGTSYSSPESYDFASLKQIFTSQGFGSFIKLVLGTAYNAVVSSYGLVLIAFIAGIVLLVRYIRTRSSATNEEAITVIFSLLLAAGTFAMSCIYFFPYAHEIYSGVNVRRADWMVYGRYIACSAGPAVILGLYLLIRKIRFNAAVEKIISFVILGLLILLFRSGIAPRMEGVSAVSRNFIQLCTFVNLNGYGMTTAVIDGLGDAICYAGILGGIICLVLITLSFIPDKAKNVRLILVSAVFIAASVSITIINYNKIRISRDDKLMSWTQESCNVLENLKVLADEYPVLVDSSAKSIKHYQFVCKEFTLGGDLTKTSEADNCFIISKKKHFVKQFFNDDYYVFDDFDYENASMDIVYVKGNRLAERLKTMGISVSKYTGKLKNSEKTDNTL